MANLWTEDLDGEPWLVNPQLLIANPRKRKVGKNMAARRKGRMPPALAKYWASRGLTNRRHHRRRHRRNPPRARRNYANAAPLFLANRRHHRRHHRRHRGWLGNPRRRQQSMELSNPRVLGFEMPQLHDILSVGAGIIVPPVVTGYVMQMLPVQYQTSQAVYWAVKVASVVGPSLLVRKFVSKRAGGLMLLAGAASLAVEVVKPYLGLTGMGAQPFLGYYVPAGQLRGSGMGKYMLPGRGAATQAAYSGTPERLLPANRF